MQVARKIASYMLTGAVVGTLLAACHGSSNNGIINTTPPTVGTFSCSSASSTSLAVTCTSTGAISADGTAVSYSWSFGDQTTATSSSTATGNGVTHTYAQPGFYNVTLTVTDNHGTTASRVNTINLSTGIPAVVAGVENWAWVSGAKSANSVGAYETQFTASPLNQPSARQNAASWTGTQGKLWMFGGAGYDSTGTVGVLNDLWMFDPATNQWTWVSGANRANATGIYSSLGVTSSTNVIGARSAAATWVDAQGNFWLFGGSGQDSTGTAGYLNDMWMLNPQTGEATWEAGASTVNNAGAGTQGVTGAKPTDNSPSGRAFATTWVDKNHVFWLFGGQNTNSAGTTVMLDDLWKYDSKANTGWVLVSGSPSTINVKGIYGTLAVGATTNYPGSRVSAQGWTDASGNLWMFGGSGFDSAGNSGSLNDLWSFNPATSTWTWVAGSSTIGAAGVYGTQKSTVAGSGGANTPGARTGTLGWTDSSGNLWLFGGSGSDSTGTAAASDGGGALNELWTFNMASQKWAWMGGLSTAGLAGVYVTAVPSITPSIYNSPGARVWGTGWVDANQNFWLFGGAGVDVTGTSGYLNDLWSVQLTVQPAN